MIRRRPPLPQHAGRSPSPPLAVHHHHQRPFNAAPTTQCDFVSLNLKSGSAQCMSDIKAIFCSSFKKCKWSCFHKTDGTLPIELSTSGTVKH
uniref:Uncharacterized protein n=1 Tax=Triticum urartu TaxID=4572 RepID=A0A8R7PDX5_TRIUA